MTTENAQYIPELNEGSPQDEDFVLHGDNEIRQLKDVLKRQFPGLASAPVVNAGEGGNSPDETLSQPDDMMLWSPLAIADFIKANWPEWNLVPAATSAVFSVNKAGNDQQINGGNTTLVRWEDKVMDDGDRFSLVNHRHTPGAAALGRWQYNVQLYYDVPGSVSNISAWCFLRHHAANGDVIREMVGKEFIATGGDVALPKLTAIFNIAAADEYVDVYTLLGGYSGDQLLGDVRQTFFDGFYIGTAPA